jgi:His-Xaa-Ser system protein HxsD
MCFDRPFSTEAIARAAHRWTAVYFLDVQIADGGTCVNVSSKDGSAIPEDVIGAFRNDVLDEYLRERVRAQTQTLHAALVEAALANIATSSAARE